MNTKALVILSFAFLGPLCGFSQMPKPAKLKLDLHSYLTTLHEKNSFSGEILIARENEIIFWEPVGLSSVENEVPIKSGSSYRVASITKTFTAALIALAQEEKKISVNDKVIKYIDGLSEKFREVTIYHLLTHTSGIPHNDGIKDYWLVKSKLQMNTKQVITEINNVDLLFLPGSKWHYSSLGYYLLATVLEKIYQEEFHNILNKVLLQKVEMAQTGAGNLLKIIPRMTTGYHLVKDDSLVIAPYRNYTMLKGAGDMYSNAADLLKWSASFFSNDLLSDKSKEMIFTSHLVNDPASKNYGYGWFLRSDMPMKYYHGGGTWGYSSYIACYPKEKITVIILSNVSTLPTESIADDIEKMVFGFPFTLPVVEASISLDSVNLMLCIHLANTCLV